MKNNKLTIIVSCIMIILIGGLAIFIVYNNSNKSIDEKYQKKLRDANKYIQEEKWEDAIGAYLECIKYNSEDEESYYALATIYLYENRLDEAKDILLQGIEKTKSGRLMDLYNSYFYVEQESTKVASGKLELNTSLLTQVSSYTFDDYDKKYSSPSYNDNGEECCVSYDNLDGVEFIYYNTDEKNNILNEKDRPNGEAMPWEVSLSDLSVLFTGKDIENNQINYSDLENMNLNNLRITNYMEKGLKVVTFKANNCSVYIECDEKGNIKTDAWNQIISDNANADTEENLDEITVTFRLRDAVNLASISSANVYLRESGETSGKYILSANTGDTGVFSMNIVPGEYTMEVSCEGYITDYFELVIDEYSNISINGITDSLCDGSYALHLSKELLEGQIRIVLEWGDYPRDLDSHLECNEDGYGNYHIDYTNKEEGSTNLDVDDVDGYGPETITINNINGDYVYYVYDFTNSGNIGSSNAVVKLYLPNEETPRVYNVPIISGNTWNIFELKDGKVIYEY